MEKGMLKSGHHRFLIFVVFLTLQFAVVRSQLLQVDQGFGRDSVRIGERTTLILRIIKDKDVIIQPFSLKDSLNEALEIIDSFRVISADSIITGYHLTSFTPGIYKMPGTNVHFMYQGKTDSLNTSDCFIRVVAPVVKESEIKDIKPPLTLPFKLREILGVLIIIFAVLLILGFGGWFLYKRYSKKGPAIPAEKILPAHVIAFRELDRLKEEKLWQNGNIKAYYSRLSDIAREYLERRFGFPAMEYVTNETILAFKKSMPHEEMLTEMLQGILETSDLVKFAKATPLPVENQGSIDNAYLFVEQTRIQEMVQIQNPGEKNSIDNIDVVKTGVE
jgi:hypothetical protein